MFPSTDPQTALSPRIIIADKNQGRPLLPMRISDDFCTSLIKAGAKFLAESSNFGSVYNIILLAIPWGGLGGAIL